MLCVVFGYDVDWCFVLVCECIDGCVVDGWIVGEEVVDVVV